MSDEREDDVIDVLKNHLGSDHTRGCQGRCYSCTCGYDTATETILARAETEIASLRAQLEEEEANAACAWNAWENVRAKLDSARKALEEIVEANDDFRGGMPDDWEGDPLQDACQKARVLLTDEKST